MALNFKGSSQNEVSRERAPHVAASAELTLVVIKSKMETDGLRTRIMQFFSAYNFILPTGKFILYYAGRKLTHYMGFNCL